VQIVLFGVPAYRDRGREGCCGMRAATSLWRGCVQLG